MKRMTMLTAGLAAACAAGPAVELSDAAQRELDAALAGRTAGPPLSCVSQPALRGHRVIGQSAILFEGTGDVVYVNRPAGGCPGLRFGQAIRTRTPTGQLCRGDIVVAFDPVSGVEYGGCALADFVPWRRE